MTVLLTTQYLEEADQLADTIALLDHGRVVARGTADQLKASLGARGRPAAVRRRRRLPARRRLADAVRADERLRIIEVATGGVSGRGARLARQLDGRPVRPR